jgi:hypothetical protein
MTAGEERDQGLLDNLLLTKDDSGDAGPDLGKPVPQCFDFMGQPLAGIALVGLLVGQ